MSIASFFKPTVGEKRSRDEAEPSSLRQPLSLAAWNANSLGNRIAYNGALVKSFLATEAPDLIFVSEVRFPAAGPPGCKSNDGKPRRRGELSKGSSALSREADQLSAFIRSNNYKAYYSLSDSKYAGSALLVKRDVAPPNSIRYSLDLSAPSTSHHPEGRVILASFDDFDLLGTYSPNNGTSEPAFERRRGWDAAIGSFLANRGSSSSGSTTKPLIWLGDLNVSAAWEDVGPDPSWFRHKNGQEATDPDDKGQPGFTANEQKRFKSLCDAGNLVDAYRLLHPVANWSTDATWRGAPGVSGPPESGRYYNKGMRIDYVLVDQTLAPRVSKATVHGKGAERVGFLGSDHCPLLVALGPKEEAKAAGEA